MLTSMFSERMVATLASLSMARLVMGDQRSYAVCDENGGRHEPIDGLIS